MIHNDVANQLQLLVKTVAAPLIEVAETPLEAPEWVPGQRLQAVVLSNLPNGRFQVLVSDHELDMNLPRNTQPGEKLELTFVAANPRPTFVLTRDMPLPQGVPSDAKLSQAARFLGALLRGDVPATGKEQAATVGRATPLLPGPPTDAPELARQLGKVLSQSGMFYESHQAQWVAGQRPLAELLLEPQGRLSPRLAQQHGAAPVLAERSVEVGKNQSAPVPVERSVEAGKNQLASMLVEQRSGEAGKNQPLNVPVSDRLPSEPVHPQATGLVRQQLEVLDGRQVVWQGQVWPGQTMEWQVEERDARGQESEPGDASEWHTTLRLQMPRLGTVSAALNLTPGGVQLKLSTNESVTAAAMKNRQEELRKSMEASGLKILSFAVEVADGQA
jgi:hypothetical protein